MKRLYLGALMVCTTFTTNLFAGEQENQIIDKLVNAYGGEALITLNNYHILTKYRTPATGQSHSPELTEIGHSAISLLVETQSNKAVLDNWNTSRGGSFQGSTIGAGDKAYTLDYQRKTYGEAGSADPHIFAGGTIRTSDTVLVYEANKVREQAALSDDVLYMNRPHHVLTIPFPQSPDLNLYIDAQTFLISKMVRVNPQLGNLDYVFSDYKTDQGVTFASSASFSIAGLPTLISTERTLKINQNLDEKQFDLPEGFKPEAERVDTSELKSTKISDRVHHVGANGAFTLFINTEMGTVAAGAYAGISERYKYYKDQSDNHKPLTYQIVTHHHSDHIGGVGEAITLGAKIVTVESNTDVIADSISPRPNKSAFLNVESKASFGSGRSQVDIYDVSTIHSHSFLLTYIAADKTIFIADHFGSPFASGTPSANLSTVDMLAAIDALNLDVKKITTAHNARVFTIQDMRKSVAEYKPTQCSANRPVCL